MQGSDSQKGVIPNAVSNIFHEISNLNSLGWKFIIKVGFQEIYNETIKDLLTNIKCDEVKMVTVQDEQTVGLLFQKAMENRKVAETQCNEMSSRSHFIF